MNDSDIQQVLANRDEWRRQAMRLEDELIASADALKLCLHVIEKGIEVRMGEQWPALEGPLREAKETARRALEQSGSVITVGQQDTEDSKRSLADEIRAACKEKRQWGLWQREFLERLADKLDAIDGDLENVAECGPGAALYSPGI